jgi:myo-inositol-1(or 4)-monophosphatase
MTTASPEPEELLEVATLAARAGSAVLLRLFDDRAARDLEVEHKGRNDLVSRADREAEDAIIGMLRSRYPDHAILAEEMGSSGVRGEGVVEWVIDPLDGTTNYLHRHPTWAVSVAARRGGELLAGVVLEPLADKTFAAHAGGGAFCNGERLRVAASPIESSLLATGFPFRAHAALDVYLGIFREVFHASRAIRRCGAAALDLAYTAAGIYGGFFELRLSAWDLAAGALLVREAGGVVTDWDGGSRFLESGNVLAASPEVHRRLLEIVAPHGGEAAVEALVPERS